MVVMIYDKLVEYILGGSNVFEICEFFWKWWCGYCFNYVDSLVCYF